MTSESHPVPFPHTKATEWQAPDEALDLTPFKDSGDRIPSDEQDESCRLLYGKGYARDTCKNAGIPCFYLNYASAECCVERIVRQIPKLNSGEANAPG